MISYEKEINVDEFRQKFNKLSSRNQKYILGVLRALKYAQEVQVDESIQRRTKEQLY